MAASAICAWSSTLLSASAMCDARSDIDLDLDRGEPASQVEPVDGDRADHHVAAQQGEGRGDQLVRNPGAAQRLREVVAVDQILGHDGGLGERSTGAALARLDAHPDVPLVAAADGDDPVLAGRPDRAGSAW